ncbi:MAG: hypothetical protein M9894_27720 [Planctomycetes bacterium]|nr:hypothetical protein [Planctomycetota bacterium]
MHGEDAPGPTEERPRAFAWRAGLVLAATLLALVPLLVPALREARPPRFEVWFFLGSLALCLPVLTVAACWWRWPLDLPRAARRDLFVLLVGATLLTAHLHHTNVDTAPFRYAHKAFADNTGWQVETQALVMRLEAGYYGHNVRFLPNAFVHGLQLVTGDFVVARTIYRLTFGFLLLLAIYTLGRAWYSHRTALLGLLLYLLIYPVSIRHYAGQVTDPMSHLSFVLGMLCIARRRDADLGLVVVVGALAKESVVALAGLHLLMRLHERRAVAPAGAVLAAGLLVVWSVRRLVYGAAVTGTTMSGVGPEHVLENLRAWPLWAPQLLFTVGVFLPFLALSWRQAPRVLRLLAAGLALLLPLSSLRFSWMYEARNFVPASIALGLIAAARLTGDPGRAEARPDDPPGRGT